MARPPSDNDFQVAFMIPRAWVKRFDALAAQAAAVPGALTTRTGMIRAAVQVGLEELERSQRPRRGRRTG